MKKFREEFKTNRIFHELFGEQTTIFDLMMIILSSVILSIIIQYLTWEILISQVKRIALLFISLDIGGGVIANFTTGTNNYYTGSTIKKYTFIVFHIVQPLILIWIFPDEYQSIIPSLVVILISTFFVVSLKEPYLQRLIGGLLMILGISTILIFNAALPAVQLILSVFCIKLIFAFGVNWNN